MAKLVFFTTVTRAWFIATDFFERLLATLPGWIHLILGCQDVHHFDRGAPASVQLGHDPHWTVDMGKKGLVAGTKII